MILWQGDVYNACPLIFFYYATTAFPLMRKIEKEAKLDEQNLCGGTNYYKSDYIKYSLSKVVEPGKPINMTDYRCHRDFYVRAEYTYIPIFRRNMPYHRRNF